MCIRDRVAIHAAYLDERINSVEIKHSVKTWKEYIERPMQWDMYSNVLYGALPTVRRLVTMPIRTAPRRMKMPTHT